MKIERIKAIQSLHEEAQLNIAHHNQDPSIWADKLKQIDILPDWYLKMFWYGTYTEIIEIIEII